MFVLAAKEFAPSDDDIKAETGGEGLTHLVAQSPTLPLLQLDDRHFEVLAYLILREKAGSDTFYDTVSLLRTGADKGRDVLLRRTTVTGIVQCKRVATRLGRVDLLIEILRLSLYAARDPSIAPEAGTRYEIWTASGLTEQARELVDHADTATLMRAELPALVARARGGIVTLKPHDDSALNDAEVSQAIDIAANLSLAHVGPEAIASELERLPYVRRQFFRSPGDGPTHASIKEIDDLMLKLRRDQLESMTASTRYRPDSYIPRRLLEETFAEFLVQDRRIFVAVGGSGQGKTSWCTHLLASPPDDRTTIFIPTEQIAASDRNPIDTIARLVTARPLDRVPQGEIDQSIWAWLDAGNRLLVVDGLDRAHANVIANLPQWLGFASEITCKASVKLVVTARPEAWTLLDQQLPGFGARVFRPDDDGKGLPSLLLGNLDYEEAAALYHAYGVSSARHRGARLRSPALIAIFAGLVDDAPAVVTRLSILEAERQKIELELRSAGVGAIAANGAMSWIGARLLSSTDGWLSVEGEHIHADALERLVASGRLVLQNGSVRLEADDVAELLLARRLSEDSLVDSINKGRADPIFMGAASLFVAMSEVQGSVDAVLGALLDNAPPGESGRMEAAAGAVLELQSPRNVLPRIRQLLTLWRRSNIELFASKVGVMINEVDLPGRTRFELVRPLLSGEDPDDWRDKYWRGDTPGRWISLFTTAIELSVAEAPTAMLAELIELASSQDRTESGVGRTLLFRAAEMSPVAVLNAAWSAQETPGAFSVASSAAPAETIRFLAEVELSSPTMTRYVVHRLWRVAHQDDLLPPGSSHAEVVRESADAMLRRVSDPMLHAQLLILRAGAERSSQALEALRARWADISDDMYWPALSVLDSDEASQRLADLISGNETNRDKDSILRAAQVQEAILIDPAVVGPPLITYAQISPEHSRTAAGVVEGMLYAQPDPAPPALEALAVELAKSEHDAARSQLIYYAGSPVRSSRATSGEVARRERLLKTIIAHETGGNVRTLVWKVIESAPERPDPQGHLNELVRRFGKDMIRSNIETYAKLPGAEGLDLDFG